MSFLQVYFKTFFYPSSAIEYLVRGNKLSWGFLAVGIPAVAYTFVYLFLIEGGGQPFHPWLNIAPEVYYQYNLFFCAPSMYLGWILSAGVVHLLSRMMTTSGSFELILVVMGFGIGVASWSTGLHDLITSGLGALRVIDQHAYEGMLKSPTIWRTLLWVQMGIYLLWFMLLFAKGVRSVYGVKLRHAGWIACSGFVIYQGFFFIFNR